MSLPALESERTLRESLKLLDANRFEELVYSTVCLQWPEAIRPAPPDGGADSFLRAEHGGPRVWQAKHFSGSISWPQCAKSLSTAVERWKPDRVTFVFGKDLTAPQEKLFREKLKADGVSVDWWGTSELLRLLLESDAGKRVARRFLDLGSDLALAVRAQGELSRGAHAVDRGLAVAQFVDELDPDYRYRIVHDAPGDPLPPHDGLRLARIQGDHRSIFDAFPRIPGSRPGAPGGAIEFAASPEGAAAAAQFHKALNSHAGGTVELGGVAKVRFQGLPALIEDMLADAEVARVTVPPIIWPVRLTIAGPLGIHSFDFDLQHVASEGGLLRDTRGALTLELKRVDRDDGSHLDLRWTYSTQRMPISSERAVLTYVRALYRGGTAQLEDREGRVKPMVIAAPDRGTDPYLEELDDYLDRLERVEAHLGTTFEATDDEPTADAARQVAEAAAVIAQGGRILKVINFKATLRTPTGTDIAAITANFETGNLHLVQSFDSEFEIHGQPVSLGDYAMQIPPAKVLSVAPEASEPETTDVTFEPSPADRDIWATLQPSGYRRGDPYVLNPGPPADETHDRAPDSGPEPT